MEARALPRQPFGRHRPSLLSDDLVRALIAAGQVDVLVGVPTLDNAKTIRKVIQAILAAFAGPLARQRTVLLDADGGSTDGSADIVRGARDREDELIVAAHPLRTVHRLSTPYHGNVGRANALRLVFAAADLASARAVVIVDPETTALTPEGIASLARPVLDGKFDLVKPLSGSSPWERPLITQLVSPLLRAAYGQRLVDPITTQFACSGRFAAATVASDVWDTPLAENGLDTWLTVRALADPTRVAQVWAPGVQEPQHARRPAAAEVFQQVVGALFESLVADLGRWLEIRGSSDATTLGEPRPPVTVRPPFDVASFADVFTQGVRECRRRSGRAPCSTRWPGHTGARCRLRRLSARSILCISGGSGLSPARPPTIRPRRPPRGWKTSGSRSRTRKPSSLHSSLQRRGDPWTKCFPCSDLPGATSWSSSGDSSLRSSRCCSSWSPAG